MSLFAIAMNGMGANHVSLQGPLCLLLPLRETSSPEDPRDGVGLRTRRI